MAAYAFSLVISGPALVKIVRFTPLSFLLRPHTPLHVVNFDDSAMRSTQPGTAGSSGRVGRSCPRGAAGEVLRESGGKAEIAPQR